MWTAPYLEALGQTQTCAQHRGEEGDIEQMSFPHDQIVKTRHTQETCHYEGGGHGLGEDLVRNQVSFKDFLLSQSLPGLSPEEPDDPGSNELRVAAKERRDPGELLLLLGGEPGDPGKGVVDKEWPQEEARPFGMARVI